MTTPDYLRRQAAILRSWARQCFDMETSARLRSMADDLDSRADQDGDDIPPGFMHPGGGKGGSNVDRNN